MEEENPNARIGDPSLNDLPEDLLLHILTFLPTMESTQTSCISRQWRHLWSRVPSLNFLFELFPATVRYLDLELDNRHFFATFIDRFLIYRSDSPIHTFRLSFIYHEHYRSHVDSWVRFAVTKLHTRELHLDFFIHRDFHDEKFPNHKYDFPFSVLRNGSVEILTIRRCSITLPAKLSTMHFGFIRSLGLDEVYLEDHMIPDLILGCPNLEDLELKNCWVKHHLTICSTRLKRLVLAYFYDYEIKETILIDCPTLCSISFHCCAFHNFVLNNASSLVEFHVFCVHLIPVLYRFWSKVVRLLEQAPEVEHLSAQNWWFEFQTSKDSFHKSFKLHNLKLLKLQTGLTQYDLLGMAALLKLCPNLETMILEYLHKREEDETIPEEFLNKPIEWSMPSLKKVTIKTYPQKNEGHNFLKILMREGVVLQEIVLFSLEVDQNGQAVVNPRPIARLHKIGSTFYRTDSSPSHNTK